jgi:hemoglobin-like flavoprotein
MNTLSPETIAIVQSTAAVMQQHGLAITTRMYERLFVDPDMKKLFDEAASKSEEQPKRPAGALLAVASNADNLDVLTATIERIAARHVATHVKAEHYPAVANALLPAIKDVLGDVADERILNAWGKRTGFWRMY